MFASLCRFIFVSLQFPSLNVPLYLLIRYNLACHRLETLLQNIDLPPLNNANNAQYFLRKPDKVVEEDQRVFSAYQDCTQLQLQLNLAHHAVQRLRVALGAVRKSLHTVNAPETQELIHNSSTEQLRTIIQYLLDTLLSLLHSNNGEQPAAPALIMGQNQKVLAFHPNSVVNCEEKFFLLKLIHSFDVHLCRQFSAGRPPEHLQCPGL